MSPGTKHNFYSDFVAASLFSLFNVVFTQFYVTMAMRQGATNVEVVILAAAPAIGLLLSPLWAAWIEQRSPKPFVIIPNLIGRLLIVVPAFIGAPSAYVFTALGAAVFGVLGTLVFIAQSKRDEPHEAVQAAQVSVRLNEESRHRHQNLASIEAKTILRRLYPS